MRLLASGPQRLGWRLLRLELRCCWRQARLALWLVALWLVALGLLHQRRLHRRLVGLGLLHWRLVGLRLLYWWLVAMRLLGRRQWGGQRGQCWLRLYGHWRTGVAVPGGHCRCRLARLWPLGRPGRLLR
ncbi:MAG TPA: hypothetical protein VGS19_19740 [Streptosporangiaceae bacterium]|nr:hypothetical protein [Streptosporangiaceae bacterium]